MPGGQVSIDLNSFATFGDLLKYLRRRVRLTQRELAIAVGYSEGQINRLERNQRTPDITTLLAIFVPALDIEDEPVTIARLSALALAARCERLDAPTMDEPQNLSQSNEVIAAISPVPENEAVLSANTVHRRVTNPYRLPRPLTAFIGREQEVKEIKHLLIQTRLVTLTGVGGIGKTRLSLEIGTGMVAHCADGVCLVELAPVTDAMCVPQAVIAALNLSEQPGRTDQEILTTRLGAKHLLLILDNCEHLITACADLVEQLLFACPRLHIMATSREALRLPGEVVWRVPPLTTPTPATPLLGETIQTYEAIRLFIQHAVAATPSFRLTNRNAQAIAQICYHLDGIPLAIEMAAAQTSVMTLPEIVTALSDRFALLTSGHRTASPRQQTLRATLDWSYALLTPLEQTLLARLAVFSGGWTAEAAHTICYVTLSFLLQLVQKSLVVAVQSDTHTRYHLLETVREYASEKLQVLAETVLMRERHLSYFVALVEETMDLGGRHVDAWVKRAQAEHDNLRTAFAWARTRDDAGEMMLRLAGGLRPFRHHRGFSNEGLSWLDEALARGSHAPVWSQAKALLAKATLLAIVWGNEHQLRTLAEESLRLFQEAGDRLGAAWSLEVLAGATPFSLGKTETTRYTQQALRLFQELDCPAGICRSLRSLSSAALEQGDHVQAAALCEESLTVAQSIDDTMAATSALSRLSLLNPERAVALSALEVVRQRQSANPERLAASLQFYGEFLLNVDAIEQAEAALIECVTLWQQLERSVAMVTGIAPALRLLGLATHMQGDYERAITLYRQATKLYQEAGGIYSIYMIRFLSASTAMMQGQYEPAAHDLRASLHHFHQQGDGLVSALIVAQLADLARRQGLVRQNIILVGAAARFERDVAYAFQMAVIGAMRRTYAQILAATRIQLVNPVFAEAWTEGTAMPWQDVVTYAQSF